MGSSHPPRRVLGWHREERASQCNHTMVIINNVGVRLVDAWIEHINITAVIFGHLPGQDSGRVLVELMYGRQSFSGRLPYTVAKQESDYGDMPDPVVPSEKTPYYPQINFTEGVYIDYKPFLLWTHIRRSSTLICSLTWTAFRQRPVCLQTLKSFCKAVQILCGTLSHACGVL